MKRFMFVALLLVMSGCVPEIRKEYDVKSVGIVKDVEYLQGSFTTYSKTILISEEDRSYVVYGLIDVGVGDTIFHISRRVYADGDMEGTDFAYSVSKSPTSVISWRDY